MSYPWGVVFDKGALCLLLYFYSNRKVEFYAICVYFEEFVLWVQGGVGGV